MLSSVNTLAVDSTLFFLFTKGSYILCSVNAIRDAIYRRKHTTDLHQRYQTSYTTPCNGIVTHGAQFEGLQVLLTTHMKANALTIFVRRVAFYTFVLTHIPAVRAGNTRP